MLVANVFSSFSLFSPFVDNSHINVLTISDNFSWLYLIGSFVSGQLRQLYYKKLESADEPTAVLGTVESVTNCTKDMCSCKSKCGKFAATPIFTLEVKSHHFILSTRLMINFLYLEVIHH